MGFLFSLSMINRIYLREPKDDFMKKLLFATAAIAALSLISISNAPAQVIKGFYKQPYKTRNNGTFDKRAGIFSIGLGAPYSYTNYYRTTFPPVYAKYEMGIIDELGIGLVGGMGLGSDRYSDNNYFTTTIGVLGYYHFNKFIPLKNLDVYAGLGIGMDINNRRSRGTEVNPMLLFKAGARYYFTHSFGVYIESAYDMLSVANAGVTFRF